MTQKLKKALGPVMLAAALAVGAAAVAGAGGGCSERKAKQQADGPTAVPVTLAAPSVKAWPRTIEVVGTLYGQEEATMSAKVPGHIDRILKDVGDVVAAGEALARVDERDYVLSRRQKEMALAEALAKLGVTSPPAADFDLTRLPTVQRAKLSADNAEAKFNRARQLHEQTPPLLSDQDFADLRTAWEVSRANYDVEMLTVRGLLTDISAKQVDLEVAEQRLKDTAILAPRPEEPATRPGETTMRPADRGEYQVTARLVSVGDYVKEGTALFRVLDDNPIKLRAAVPERFVRQVAVGQAVAVTLDAYPEPFAGKVARINPQIDATNRTFQVEVQVPNDKHLLKAGAFARASILTRTDSAVVFVPLESIVTAAGRSKLFVVREGKAVQVDVEPGERDGELVEVSGMERPEQVVVSLSLSKLATGVPVRVEQPAPTTVPASSASTGE